MVDVRLVDEYAAVDVVKAALLGIGQPWWTPGV